MIAIQKEGSFDAVYVGMEKGKRAPGLAGLAADMRAYQLSRPQAPNQLPPS